MCAQVHNYVQRRQIPSFRSRYTVVDYRCQVMKANLLRKKEEGAPGGSRGLVA